MRYYLLTMLLVPLINLFDQWIASRTDHENYTGCIPVGRSFGWVTYGARREIPNGRVFYWIVPWVRSWELVPFSNFRFGYGWARLLVLHVTGQGVGSIGWSSQWIPVLESERG